MLDCVFEVYQAELMRGKVFFQKLEVGKTEILVDILDIAVKLLTVLFTVHCLFWVFMLKALTGPDHCPAAPASMRWLAWSKQYSIYGICMLFSVGWPLKTNISCKRLCTIQHCVNRAFPAC